MNTVIVTGPQGCGKTLHAAKLKAHFGCTSVVDEWWSGDPIVPGALHLTCELLPAGVSSPGVQVAHWPVAGIGL